MTWREMPLSNVGLKPRELEPLARVGITTVGELANYSNLFFGGYYLTEIDGISEADAEAIEKKMEMFWPTRNEACAS